MENSLIQSEDPEEDTILDDVKVALKEVVESLERGDNNAHTEMRAAYKKHILYWHGIQKLLQDDISRQWLTPDGFLKVHQDVKIPDNAMGDRSINVYRAHGESIIAALTTGLPVTKFFPDDADSSEDLNTAKAASKIAELVQLRNEATIKFIYALFLMYNQGLVAAYTYHDKDKKYGVIEREVQTGMANETLPGPATCPDCSYPFEEEDLIEGFYNCKQCGQVIPQDEAVVQDYDTEVPQFETVEDPKSNEVIELFGPLNVKIAPYARTLADSPYLILEVEVHYSKVREIYPELFNEIKPMGDQTLYHRALRADYDNKDLLTVRKVWLRPWALNILEEGKEEIRKELKSKFADGLCVTFVDKDLVDVDDDILDDHWTINANPLGERVYSDPLGAPLISIQEIRTEIVDLIVETLEKGIPQTFADPDVLDFEAYEKTPNAVGMVFPAKAQGNQNLDNAFTQLKTANLSDETRYFLAQLEQDAQFVGGAFPSVFGGILKGGSNTASEYEMSRNQALQRLSTAWKIINNLWIKVIEKAVKSYIKNVQDDEKMVKPQGDSFINVWIKKEELSGKLGGVEAENSEQFPSSWIQQRGMLLEIMGFGNPMLDQALYDPENVNTVNRILAIPGIKIPGADDRDKQLAEIAELLKSGPTPMIDQMTGMPVIDPMTGQPVMQSSIPIDMDVDNHGTQAYVCMAWAVSSVGRSTKEINPQGYMNVIAHMKEHRQLIPPPVPEGAETVEDIAPEEEAV